MLLNEENELLVKHPGFKTLAAELSAGELVLFIGSGLSIGIYDEWSELVKELCEGCGVDASAVDWGSGDRDMFLDMAQKAKDADEEKYISILEQKFEYAPKIEKRILSWQE